MIAKLQVTKGKSRLIGLHQIFNLLCFQGYCQDSEKTTHQMGGNIYKLYLIKDLDLEYIRTLTKQFF